MEVPQAAAFLGQTVDVWVGIFMAVLAAYAVVVLARRKRRSFASLSDEEHYEEPPMQPAADWAAPENALSPEALAFGPAVKSPPIAARQPETRS